MYKFVLIILLLTTLISYTKKVHLDIPNTEPKLVVQGSIEVGLPPFIVLTKSIESFTKTIVSNAKITFYDGTRTVQLDTVKSDTISGDRLQKLAEYLNVTY